MARIANTSASFLLCCTYLLCSSNFHGIEALEAVDCRVTINSITFEEGHTDEISCIPILSGKESDDIFPIEIPRDFLLKNEEAIYSSSSYLRIQGAKYIENDSLRMQSNATFTMYGKNGSDRRLPYHLRRYRERRKLSYTPGYQGTRTLGVVRICTTEAGGRLKCPTKSAKQLYDGIFGKRVTVQSQYKHCSGGKLNWIPNKYGVKQVTLPNPIGQYSRATMESTTQRIIKAELKLSSLAHFASNTMFIMPPGLNFLAAAPKSHWRSSYNDLWGLSLVGAMHEIGHNFNLGHAYVNNREYEGREGNMGSGGVASGAPMKCFNAANHDKLGWFSDRSLSLGTTELRNPKIINIAAFVDYSKAGNSDPVNVSIVGKYFMQYNRKTRHNRNTEQFGDMLTISTRRSNSGTDHFRALGVGQEVTIEEGIKIRVCRQTTGNTRDADTLVVSVGVNGHACNNQLQAQQSAVSNVFIHTGNLPNGKSCKVLTTAQASGHYTSWKARQSGQRSQGNGAVRWRQTQPAKRRWTGLEYLGVNAAKSRQCWSTPGATWEIRAKIRLIRHGTSVGPASCDLQSGMASWRRGCPQLLLQYQDSAGRFKRLYLRDYVESTWNAGGFNDFRTTVTLPAKMSLGPAKMLRTTFISFPDNTDLVVKDFEIVQV